MCHRLRETSTTVCSEVLPLRGMIRLEYMYAVIESRGRSDVINAVAVSWCCACKCKAETNFAKISLFGLSVTFLSPLAWKFHCRQFATSAASFITLRVCLRLSQAPHLIFLPSLKSVLLH